MSPLNKKPTKADLEDYLNGIPVPDHDKKSNGGRIPDTCHYGSWLRRNDPIAFEVAYDDFLDMNL